jgi:predicted Zn-dependent protease
MSLTDLSADNIEQTISIVLELALAVDADEHRVILEPQISPDEELQIYDPAILVTQVEEEVEFAMKVERAALEADRRDVMTLTALYLDGAADVSPTNPKGFSATIK